eukprot:TRINITY_DN11280_c0_g1_i1.p1 TRINITY_DN11280_c0_g1~~TRINITY_DN11280_c0_g1_i1.p1  ORF type:complete len:286 (+),score=38.27 TRINITY_DN11280_c0_g1_i1:112-858(+)
MGQSLGGASQPLPVVARQTVQKELRVCLVGGFGVGKASVSNRMAKDTFDNERFASFTCSRLIDVNGIIVKFQMWRLGGCFTRSQESMRLFWRGAAIAMFVYDITSRDSLSMLLLYVRDFKYYRVYCESVGIQPAQLVFVGNKTDLEEHRTVNRAEVAELARKYNALHFEVSAKEDQGVIKQMSIDCAKHYCRYRNPKHTLVDLTCDCIGKHAIEHFGGLETLRTASLLPTELLDQIEQRHYIQRIISQ